MSVATIASLELDSGQTLSDIEIAYETYGTLNAEKSNAILICHALTGSAEAMGSDDEPGWWAHYVGPGKALDPDTHFIISSNVLGSCKGSTGPTSVNPDTGTPYGDDFPVITIHDMVRAQAALIDQLGIDKLHAVVGGSMGGMQVLAWSIAYPDKMAKCLAIATTSKLSTQGLAFNAVGRKAIQSDSDTGLSIARMIGHITYLSNQSLSDRFGRKLQEKEELGFAHSTDFQIESYLHHQGDKFISRFDAKSYVVLSKALTYFDLERTYGSLEHAFREIKASFLFIGIDSDWLYPPEQSLEMVHSLVKLDKHVSYAQLNSPYGHDAFLLPSEQLTSLMKGFL